MDFSLSTDHEILRDSVRSFAENEIKPVAAELDAKEEFSYETMQKMAELGLFGVFVSEKYGGQAMDYQSYIIGNYEISNFWKRVGVKRNVFTKVCSSSITRSNE